MATTKICSVPDCGKPTKKGRRWCYGHYARWNNHGDPTAGRARHGALADFIERVAIPFMGDDCLIWPFGTVPAGYGCIKVNGRNTCVHRLVCERKRGPAPSDVHQAAHSCGNRICCNPNHLRWATVGENTNDRWSHGTMAAGEASKFAKLTEAQVKEIIAFKGRMTRREIAARYGVSYDLIGLIHRGRVWRHVTAP